MAKAKIETITPSELNSMSKKELQDLLAKTKKIVDRRVSKIVESPYVDLLDKSSIPRVKTFGNKTRAELINYAKSYKAFLSGSTSSTAKIRSSLSTAYTLYKKKKRVTDDFTPISPTNVREAEFKITRGKNKGKTRKGLKDIKTGKEVIIRMTRTGEQVYVEKGTKSNALITRGQFKKGMRLTQELERSGALSHYPSDVEAKIKWFVKRGYIKGLSGNSKYLQSDIEKLELLADYALGNKTALTKEEQEFIDKVPSIVLESLSE